MRRIGAGDSGYKRDFGDVWVSTLARQPDLAVVSRDAHFDQVKDLQRVSW